MLYKSLFHLDEMTSLIGDFLPEKWSFSCVPVQKLILDQNKLTKMVGVSLKTLNFQ